jgi:hypothetical protein
MVNLVAFSAMSVSQTAPSYRWQSVKVVAGGFITGIIPHPNVPRLMYVRTDIGGAYRYDAQLGRWTPITDIFNAADWNLLGTESIAIDPVDPYRVYLAQGTYTQSWAGNGAIGATFKRTDLPIKLGPTKPVGTRVSGWRSILCGTKFCSWALATTDFGKAPTSARVGTVGRMTSNPSLIGKVR